MPQRFSPNSDLRDNSHPWRDQVHAWSMLMVWLGERLVRVFYPLHAAHPPSST